MYNLIVYNLIITFRKRKAGKIINKDFKRHIININIYKGEG